MHFDPIEIDGIKFDKGMCLYEFDAFREPEKTRFQKIGEYVKARCPMNEIPTPQMYWQGKYWPDLYIANQLDAVPGWCGDDVLFHPSMRDKREWPDDVALSSVSGAWHGSQFHDAFIEPMCRKITGRGSDEIAAKYHRAVWLPIFYPETLREGKSLRTPFYYPRGGNAGAAIDAERSPANAQLLDDSGGGNNRLETAPITLTFLLAKPRHEFSVLFVVDDSPIYRITDMDVCAGIETEWHRWVVEGSSPMSPAHLSQAIHLGDTVQLNGTRTINLPLPTIANVKRGWKPAKNMNEKIWETCFAPE